MCGVVCILLYCILYQSSLWLPDFNKLLVFVLYLTYMPEHNVYLYCGFCIFLCNCAICSKRRIRTNLGVSSGLVGCIESLRIASKTLNVQYDLQMPGSNDIEAAHGIRAYLPFHCNVKFMGTRRWSSRPRPLTPETETWPYQPRRDVVTSRYVTETLKYTLYWLQ